MAKILNASINPNQLNGRSFYIKDLENKISIFKPNDVLSVSQETADNILLMYPNEIKILEKDETKTAKKEGK